MFLDRVLLPKAIKKIEHEALNSSGRGNDSKTLLGIIHVLYADLEDCNSSLECLTKLWNTWSIDHKKTTQKNYKIIFSKMATLIRTIWPVITTQSSRFTDFKAKLKIRFKDNSKMMTIIDHNLTIGKKQRDDIKKEDVIKLNEKLDNRGNRDFFQANDIYSVIEQNIYSDDGHKRAIAVMLAVGSRFVEVYKISKYELDPDNKDNIIINGVAKTKLNSDVVLEGTNNVRFSKPVIHSNPQEIIDSVALVSKR